MGPLRAYVLAKLLWNPDTDVQKHTSEFLKAYYGEAAPGIKAYLDLVESQVRGGKAHAHIFDSPKVPYLNTDFSAQADKLLANAESAATDETTRFRVQVARLPVWYVLLVNDRVQGEAKTQLREQFLQVARKAKISNISESKSLEDWAK